MVWLDFGSVWLGMPSIPSTSVSFDRDPSHPKEVPKTARPNHMVGGVACLSSSHLKPHLCAEAKLFCFSSN